MKNMIASNIIVITIILCNLQVSDIIVVGNAYGSCQAIILKCFEVHYFSHILAIFIATPIIILSK